MMEYRMFIDDERYPATPSWMIARSSYDAIWMVTNWGMPTEIAFDHDLGGPDTAMMFISWLEEQLMDGEVELPSNFNYSVHSQNVVGAANIKSRMDQIIKHF